MYLIIFSINIERLSFQLLGNIIVLFFYKFPSSLDNFPFENNLKIFTPS